MLAASPRAPLASLSNRENLISLTMGNKSALNKVTAPHPPQSQLNTPLEKVTIPGTIPLQELQLIALIGEGGFGSVYSGIDNKYGEVAVKICNIGDSADVEDVAHEISVHRKLQPRGSFKEGMHVQFYYHIEQPTRSLIVMELIKGVDLEDYAALRPHGRLEESEARAIAFPFLKAIEYFHSQGVAHLDIKPTNLLIDQNGYPRLIDYGSSAIFEGSEGLVTEQGGTDNYKAPERHEATTDEEFCGPAADM
ncbi:hypothetical protein AB1Y20_011708 [Prymnesium parvum]|uniref:non-specific serine/threonine protein kinase n=1 Tax=Prymnesium parvum TaxID=97485 RepID=A0AB34IJW6_PRYPA